MRTVQGSQAMLHTLISGARKTGGLTPERAETMLTIMIEHPYFSGIEEHDLRRQLEEACRRPPVPYGTQADALDDVALTAQLMAIVLRAEHDPGRQQLVDMAIQIGLNAETAAQIVDGDIPAELAILLSSHAPEEVYLDVLLAAAAADGHFASEEMDKLVAYATSRLELRLLPKAEIEDLMQASWQGFLSHGFTDWLSSLPEALPRLEQRQTAYQLAHEMIHADNVIHEDEQAFMHQLADALGLPR